MFFFSFPRLTVFPNYQPVLRSFSMFVSGPVLWQMLWYGLHLCTRLLPFISFNNFMLWGFFTFLIKSVITVLQFIVIAIFFCNGKSVLYIKNLTDAACEFAVS
jgi:hypothetical protein